MTSPRPQRIAAAMASALLLTTGGLALAGCGDDQTSPAATSATTAQDSVTTFTSDDTNAEVALGARFVISLPETAGTGYQWNTAGGTAAGSVVQLFDDAFVPDNPDAVGSSGKRNFTYDTAKAGSGRLNFRLLPPGSTTPDDTVTFQVTVK
jgi:predicted secreted protein